MMILVFVVQFIFADGGKKDGDKTDSVPLIPTIDISVKIRVTFVVMTGGEKTELNKTTDDD